MEDLAALITLMVDLMKIPFTIWGFTLSFWDIMLSVGAGGIVIYLIVGFLND